MLSWARRRPLLTGIAAGTMAAALIAGVVFVTARPSSLPRYSRLPPPCATVTRTSLAAFMPGATGTPQALESVGGTSSAACKWNSTDGSMDRTLTARITLFRPSGANRDAQVSYRRFLTGLRCRCTGVTPVEQPVTGLGDQAAEVFVVARPGASIMTAPAVADPGANLLVQSGNALLILNLETTSAASGIPLDSPPGADRVNGMAAMARDMLAALDRPTSVSPSTPLAAVPHYLRRRDPCRLVTAATLARYVPGALVGPEPDLGSGPGSAASPSPGSSQMTSCVWDTDTRVVTLYLYLYGDAGYAQQAFEAGGEGFGQSASGVTVTGSQWVPDVGEGAAATFTARAVDLHVWSGNAELDYQYFARDGAVPRAVLLAGVMAMARDGLAALARPAASALPTDPGYALPRAACPLVRTSTLARYGPGARADEISPSDIAGIPRSRECGWGTDNGSIFLTVTLYAGPDDAQGGYEADVRQAREGGAGFKFQGARVVHGIGEQATAVYREDDGSPAAVLYAWSRNATVEISVTDLTGSTPLSRAGKLAADSAMARDVLAGLRHTGSGPT